MTGAIDHLERRAASYSRDAFVLREDGDVAMAVAYRTIADELRTTADFLRSESDRAEVVR